MDFALTVRDETCLDVGRIGSHSPPGFFLDKEFFSAPSFILWAWENGGFMGGRRIYVYEF